MGSACVRPRAVEPERRGNADEPTVPETSTELADVPSPEELIADFEKVNLAEQPYAEVMFQRGREPKSDAEKVFRSRYTANLLNDAARAAEAKADVGEDFSTVFRRIPPLTATIVYDADRWTSEVVPQYQAAVDALNGAPNTAEVEQLRGMLLKVKDLFYWEVQNPKQDFYMCVLDEMVNKYGGEHEVRKVSQESLRMMHCIDMAVHRRKTDGRRDLIAAYFERLYDQGVAGHGAWDLQDVVLQHGDEAEIKTLSSETPLLSFELNELDPTFPGFVLMEGNGRLAALNAALDVVRTRHPDFIAPLVEIAVVPFQGPELARRNVNFLLLLTWSCSFPALEIPGWRGQVQNSHRSVSKETGETVRSRPRYYGYSPIA